MENLMTPICVLYLQENYINTISYLNINKKIVNTYEYNILCNMLTYIHNINLFNCICLVDNNRDQLYYGRRKER